MEKGCIRNKWVNNSNNPVNNKNNFKVYFSRNLFLITIDVKDLQNTTTAQQKPWQGSNNHALSTYFDTKQFVAQSFACGSKTVLWGRYVPPSCNRGWGAGGGAGHWAIIL